MRYPRKFLSPCTAFLQALALGLSSLGYATPPNLTAPGAIQAIKADPNNTTTPYTETYNLGATGLRGWIYIDRTNKEAGDQGLITAPSRQILVTVASAPGNAVLAVDDVILGAMRGSTGSVPFFSKDCRKELAEAIGDAERFRPILPPTAEPTTDFGLRVKRWRGPAPGNYADVNIDIEELGTYSPTSPFLCTKSDNIIAKSRATLVSQMRADRHFFVNRVHQSTGVNGPLNGLALLAVVKPTDPEYAEVEPKLREFAQWLAANGLYYEPRHAWAWAYRNIFLSEYYLRTVADGTPDPSILTGIVRNTMALANMQSRYGTYGHGGCLPNADGTPNGSVPPYGPINAVGIPANIGIVLGRKAMMAGSATVAPQIDEAIQRASKFFGYYKNKGSIPYGEHQPWLKGHSSNGKDSMCAMLFALQADRPAETEYFTRMSIASCTGREVGHDNQQFSYFWGAVAANIGGQSATTKYLENCRWQIDLARRTDGSFTYEGREDYGGGATVDGTYLGESINYNFSPTACHIMSYAVALQRLSITGKDSNPANTLSAAKLAKTMAAATFKQDCPAFTVPQLITALSEYDPIVRNDAAVELAKRIPGEPHVATLISMLTDTANANGRMGACQTLGILKNIAALPIINGLLKDPDLWVRAKAALAIMMYDVSETGLYCNSMLTTFTDNATDPEVIVWDDPIQISNRFLSTALFGNPIQDEFEGNCIFDYTKNAPRNLLYPAIRTGLKQPDSYPRFGAAHFVETHLNLADVQALTPDIFEVITSTCQADPMWYFCPQHSGLRTLRKFRCAEAIPLAFSKLNVKPSRGWGASYIMPPYMEDLKAYGDLSRWTLPLLKNDVITSLDFLDRGDFLKVEPQINDTIATVGAAITSPPGVINLLPIATSQIIVTTGSKGITLTGISPRGAVTFTDVTPPAHGTLSGTAPNLTYTPADGYSGPDHFYFKAKDTLMTSDPGMVSIIVGSAGTGLRGEYYDNSNFTNLKLTRTDAQVDFDWGMGSPATSIGADTYSVRWSGQILVPETGKYTFSTLNSDGVRLYINGVATIDDFTDHTTSWNDSNSVDLTAGQRVDVQMDYYENSGSAVAKLKWTGPTFAGRNGVIIAKEWLYDGSGLSGSRAYAHAQNLSMVQNTDLPITLSGSGANPNLLTYTIVSQPTHGTFPQSAPNLIYRPSSNYSGMDSFTFVVSNGNNTSTPATISINITAGQPSPYFWTQAVSGNWSGASWTNAAGASVTPMTTGGSSYHLNFNQSGTYAATHNLSDDFAFNQLNFASNVTLEGSKSLSSTANGRFLPQINQNATSTITIKLPLNLAATTTVTATNLGEVILPLMVSGAGGLILNGEGRLAILTAPSNPLNTYSGGTVINDGTLILGSSVNGGLCVNPTGTGPVMLNARGIIELGYVTINSPLITNGGMIILQNGYGANWVGPIALNSDLKVEARYPFRCSGVISGPGGLTKDGRSPLTLSNSNNYTGNTFVKEGTLKCAAEGLGMGILDITDGGKVDLDFTGTRVIAGLKYSGLAVTTAGTYGSSASPANYKNDNYFSGPGTVTIGTSTNALPVSSGLVLRMDASQIAETLDGAQLNTWVDTSGAKNNAVRQNGSISGYPKYIANGVNDRPVVRFNSSNSNTGDYLKFNRLSNIRSVFWVLKETSGLADSHFLLGDSSTYDFHRGSTPNGPLWDADYSSANIRNGATKLMGNTINGTTTSLPSGNFQLVSLVTTGDVSAEQICQDRIYHGSWEGDIAEILIYNRALTSAEEAAVGTYLATKYGLVTSYPLAATPAVPAAVTATAESTVTGAVRVSWAPVSGAAAYSIWSRNTQSGAVQNTSSNTSSFLVSGLTVGTLYEFKVSAVYGSGVAGCYSDTVSATPVVATSTYATWAANTNQRLTPGVNNGPTDDPDKDGISNLLEFVLGGAPMSHSRAILPILRKINGNWFFEYSRSDFSQDCTTQAVEYSSDLKAWTQISISVPLNSAVVVAPGSPADIIKVAIPSLPGRPMFARLKVTQ